MNRLLPAVFLAAALGAGCQAPLTSDRVLTRIAAAEWGTAIAGRVRDARGAAVAGAVVKAAPSTGGADAASTVTDPDGRYALAVPPGLPFTVTASSARLAQSAVRYHVLATETVDINLTPTTSISGTVTLLSGGNPAGALVFVPGTSYMATADTAGRFTIAGVPVGAYVVAASMPGYQTAFGEESIQATDQSPVDGVAISLSTSSVPRVPAPPAVYGSAYETASLLTATIGAGGDVPFGTNGPMAGITHAAGTAGFTAPEPGVYAVRYGVSYTAGIGSAVGIAVNGAVQPSTVLRLLLSTGAVDGQTMLQLSAGDVVTLRNGGLLPVTLGLAPGVSSQLTIQKL